MPLDLVTAVDFGLPGAAAVAAQVLGSRVSAECAEGVRNTVKPACGVTNIAAVLKVRAAVQGTVAIFPFGHRSILAQIG